jgi:hypothetical protein
MTIPYSKFAEWIFLEVKLWRKNMPKKDVFELPSKGTWRDMKEVKDRKLRHLKVTTGDNTTILDSPFAFNFRFIPKVFTAPFRAVGLVTSIFARLTNTKISLHMKDNEE